MARSRMRQAGRPPCSWRRWTRIMNLNGSTAARASSASAAKEIGIHAIRGGTVAGEHTVLYLGEDESLKITHTASSRMIFVNGAWKALDFMAKRPNGYYTMKDLTGEEQ